jgi:hypothetical protein
MDASFKSRCITLRKKGYSIIQIMQATGRAKTSIYTHIRDIPLSTERWKEIRKASGLHIRKFALARKGKSTRPFSRFDSWTPETVLLVSHLLFDGEIAHGKCTYNNRSEALVNRFEQLMGGVYSFPPKRYFNALSGVIRSAYFNVELSLYLQKKSEELLKQIRTLPLDLKREFLRAFFDDEGCVDFKLTKKRRVRGYQKAMQILLLVKDLLSDLNIQSRVNRPNEVVISGKINLLRFQEEINFSQGVRVNGNRSNSVWKQHLEKREILRRAIASFKS